MYLQRPQRFRVSPRQRVDFSPRLRIAMPLPRLLPKEWFGFLAENSPWAQTIRPTWTPSA